MTLLDILPSIGHPAPGRMDPAISPATTHSDGSAAPSCEIDETGFRRRARRYRKALRGIRLAYAGKSPLTTAVARWAREEGLGVDVRSTRELAAALAGGVDPARITMRGNARSPQELGDAVRAGVGRIVLDSAIEIAYLAGLGRQRQRVLVRVNIGDHAADAVKRVLAHPTLELVGLHCPIGSEGSDPACYGEAIHRMIAAMADVRSGHGVILTEVDIAAGQLNPDELAAVIEDALDEACAAEHFPRPAVVVDVF